MTAVSLLWLGGPRWGVPDLSDGAHVARFGWLLYILSNTSLWDGEKTASLPGNVKPLWQLFAGTALWYYFEGSWQRLTLVSRLTGRSLICICKVLVQINNIWCGSHGSDIRKKFENKETRCWIINVAKNIKAWKEKKQKHKRTDLWSQTKSTEGGVVAQDTPMPANALISKLITLALILYLWFMELTTDLTHAFHYAWLVGNETLLQQPIKKKKFWHFFMNLSLGQG